jgi:hypothetical protein
MKKYPTSPNYQFKPFSHHIDGGFGAHGDAFRKAALSLEQSVNGKNFLNSSLPIAYLHRHAVELFLKSCIIVLHRGLRVPFGGKQQERPTIKIGEDWVPIQGVHSLGDLYWYFASVLQEHISELSKITSTDWDTIPHELGQWISQIDEFDKKSTAFRYPGSGDDFKSDFRESSVEETWSLMAPESEPVKKFLEFDESHNLVGSFCLDPSRLEPIMEALRNASKTLSTLHFALRCELGNGN